MTTPLLQTKLYIPPVQPGLVPRSRLIERLNQGIRLGCKLILVSAPAGFGKTTLLSEWIASTDRPVAWVSLESRAAEIAVKASVCEAARHRASAESNARTLSGRDTRCHHAGQA